MNHKNNFIKTANKIGVGLEPFILILIVLAVWIAFDKTGRLNTVVMPSFDKVVGTFVKKISDGSLVIQLFISLVRVLKGYFLSAILGIGLGIAIGLSEHTKRMSDLLIHFIKPIPPIAWIPLVILWLGIEESSKVFLIFIGGFFTILINVIDGIRYTDQKLLEVAKVMETPKLKLITKLIIPAALPNIFTGLRIGMSSCWTCVVAAELVASTSGIGFMISNARNFGQMDVIVVGMVVIGVTGRIMDLIIRAIEKRAIVWSS